MKISAKDVDYCKLTTNEKDKSIYKATIKAHVCLLGLYGKHLKSLKNGKNKEHLT